MNKTTFALLVSVLATPAYAQLEHRLKTSAENRSTSSSNSTRETDAYQAEYTASYLTSIDPVHTTFVRASAIVTNSSVALNSLDEEIVNQTPKDEDHFILRLREAWWQIAQQSGFNKDVITLGLYRVRMSPYWIDDEIESISWQVNTTKTAWQMGLGEQLSSYNTSTTLNVQDKGKLVLWGQVANDWAPYHSLHINSLFVTQHTNVNTNDISNAYLGPLNGDYLWLGIGGSHNWLTLDDPTSRIGYHFEVTALLGDGDIFNNEKDMWQNENTSAMSVLGGLRFQPSAHDWFLGSTIAYASGSEDGKGTFFQSGYESNKGTYLGTRDQAYQFNYALNASVSNLVSASLFSAYQIDEAWSVNGAVSSYVRADTTAPAYRRSRALETNQADRDIGTGLDLEATYRAKHFFSLNNTIRAKFRASRFIVGNALASYDDETRLHLELTMEL
ncbi:alginate export family protein [Enterovibrio calviensis]|uniref:alginate export family protein n=1 Tax=Enterovibrio calviensis TaxID=91359 RepID=UPI003734CE25